MVSKSSPKVLFIHNSITWYRIPLFIEIDKIINTFFVFTKVKDGQEFYKNINTDCRELSNIKYAITNNHFKISWKSLSLVLKNDYDVVLVTVLDSMDQCFESIISCIIAKIRGKKVAYFWERWDPPADDLSIKSKIRKNLKKIIFKFIIKNSNVLLSPGIKSKEYFLNNGADENKIVICKDSSEIEVKNYVDIRDKYNIDKNKKIILYFGRIIKRKGLDDLIKAFSKLEKEKKDVFLLICGDGDFKKECEDLASDLKIKEILFTGIIQPEERASYYSQCDLFVLPSNFYMGENEAWGLSVNEAMQFGKPIISTTAVGASFDLIKNDYNGYRINASNIDELFGALLKITSDDVLIEKMGMNSKKIINDFRYKNMAEGFKNAFLYAYKN